MNVVTFATKYELLLLEHNIIHVFYASLFYNFECSGYAWKCFQTCFINSLFMQKRNKHSVSKWSTALPHTRKVCITNAWYVTVELMIKRISVGFQNITNVANIFNSKLLL